MFVLRLGRIFSEEGGTISPDSPAYIERKADTELFLRLKQGELCYVLDSRQKGKSSLMARTMVKLRQAGIATAHLDLQSLGTNLDPERWYFGMLWVLGECLGLQEAMFEAWASNPQLSAFARWSHAIETVILPRLSSQLSAGQSMSEDRISISRPAERLVIFIDEIDLVRSLDFSTDEFFHGIRELYNRRSTDPRYNRITFCLIGVAKPSELVRDPRVTPFNVGRRIDLADFTVKEALSLAKLFVEAGIASNDEHAERLIDRIIYWTNGHPYLTQKVCAALEREGGNKTKEDVDRVVNDQFFKPESMQEEPNISDVARRVLELPPDGMAHEKYLYVLSERLELLFRRGILSADEGDPILKTLRLAGLTRSSGHSVKLRNRIYERTFNLTWLTANIPDLEIRVTQRKQRQAWLRRMIGLGSVAFVFAAATVGLLLLYLGAVHARDEAEALKKDADLQLTQAQAERALAEQNRIIAEEKARKANESLDLVAAEVAKMFAINAVARPPAGQPEMANGATSLPPTEALPGGKYRFTHERYVTTDDLAGKTKGDLQGMINEMYARYLFAFPSRDVTKYKRMFAGYEPLRTWQQCEALFNPFERFNIRFLAKYRNNPRLLAALTKTETVDGPTAVPEEVSVCTGTGQPASEHCRETEMKPRGKVSNLRECSAHKPSVPVTPPSNDNQHPSPSG